MKRKRAGSPEDSLSIDDFYHVYGYVCFYKADMGGNDSISTEDLTITFIRGKYPRKLIKHWRKNRHYEISQAEAGKFQEVKSGYIFDRKISTGYNSNKIVPKYVQSA